MAKTLLISGWRFLPHSYAIVDHFQCLELLKIEGIELRFEDRPYYSKEWQAVRGLVEPADEALIESIPPLAAGETADVELRITFPYDLAGESKAQRLFVFGTAEHKGIPPGYITGGGPLPEVLSAHPAVSIITPSRWSREGFIASGASPERVAVVPHGVDPAIFRPASAEERLAGRGAYGLEDDEFTFLTIGAMTGTKNVNLTLRAFAGVLQRHPRARLILKGADDLYRSYEMFKAALAQALPGIEMAMVLPRIRYIGSSLSFSEMARLYHAADCYVTPYSAEGFNMPALEAAACGLPVICTAGGPTDDFLTDDSALRIRSTETKIDILGTLMGTLAPDAAHLQELMLRIVDDGDVRRLAASAGPAHVYASFTWRRAVEKLLRVLFPDQLFE